MRGFPCYPASLGVKKGLDTNRECNGIAGKPVLLKIAILMFTGELGGSCCMFYTLIFLFNVPYDLHENLVQCPIWFTWKSSGSMSHDLHENLPVQCPIWFTWKSSCSRSYMIYMKIFLFNVPYDLHENLPVQCPMCFCTHLPVQWHACFTWRFFLISQWISVTCILHVIFLISIACVLHADLSIPCHLCFTCRSFWSVSLVLYMQIFLINATCVLHADLLVQCHLCFLCKSSCSMSLVSYMQIFLMCFTHKSTCSKSRNENLTAW